MLHDTIYNQEPHPMSLFPRDIVAYFCAGWKQIGIAERQLHGQNRRPE